MYNFKLIFNVKLIYSIQILGPLPWVNNPFFFSYLMVGVRKGRSGANAPPVHGTKMPFKTRLQKSLISKAEVYNLFETISSHAFAINNNTF